MDIDGVVFGLLFLLLVGYYLGLDFVFVSTEVATVVGVVGYYCTVASFYVLDGGIFGFLDVIYCICWVIPYCTYLPQINVACRLLLNIIELPPPKIALLFPLINTLGL